jgi:hypothetical protein
MGALDQRLPADLVQFDMGAGQTLPSAKCGAIKPIFTLAEHDELRRL